MEPFVALMRRYVVDYTNRHDPAVCAEIMAPDYTLTMGAHVIQGRDEHYVPAAAVQFKQFPGLCLTVHQLVTNGDHLAMRFSEHGASIRHGANRAAWRGLGIYRWDCTVLRENHVEQDYLSRRRQLGGGTPDDIDPPAVAPWDTVAEPADAGAENVVRGWVLAGMTGERVRHDDDSDRVLLDHTRTEIDRMFSAGEHVAFRATIRGQYVGGLEEAREEQGSEVTLHATGIVRVQGENVTHGYVVNNRLDVLRALTRHEKL